MLATLIRQMTLRRDEIAFTGDSSRVTNGELLQQASSIAATIGPAFRTIGLSGPNGIGWVAAYIGCLMAGRTVVPIPAFFSHEQQRHIAADAEIDMILSTAPDALTASENRAVPTRCITAIPPTVTPPRTSEDWRLVIYTSGTTGRPKGVRLGPRQVSASVNALTTTIMPRRTDRYLSVLPFALLLEQIAGILVPLMAGIRSDIATGAAASAMTGDIVPLIRAIDRTGPGITVLVPELLEGWVAAQERRSAPPPENLRFVAVGGAAVPAGLIARARAAGIPAYAGYGLSECCSVVAVNTPGADRAGSVGRCLPGLAVAIVDHEIVVSGPTVMDGYLGAAPAGARWHTGDNGHIDADGFVYVHGRRDNILVTARGRNVNPEWIECMLSGDPRLARCVLCGNGLATPRIVLVPAAGWRDWFDTASEGDILNWIDDRCGAAPAYARPGSFIVTSDDALRAASCLTVAGRPDRRAIEARHGAPEASLLVDH